MTVVIGYIAIVGILRIVLFDKKNIKLFTLVAGFLLFTIAALRSIEFGPDLIGYVGNYEELVYRDLSVLIKEFLTGNGKDPFFYIFSKLFSIIGANYQLWLGILSGIYIFSTERIIRKYSPYPYLSYIAFISLGYFSFSLTGLRQTLALSLILLSYPFLKERKILPFIALVFIGSLFHSSALIFLLSYPLMNMKLGFKHILGIGFALILSMLFGNYIKYFVGILSWTESLSNYAVQETTLSYSGFIIQLFIFLFCLLFKQTVLEVDERNLTLYNLLFLGLLFQAFTPVIAEFFRVSMYFSIFSIILVPKAIKAIENRNLRVLVYLIIFIALGIYILWTNSFNDYKFFWN